MPKNSIERKDLETLIQLNLLDVVGLSKASEEEKIKYLQKFSELVWTLFFEEDAKDLPEDELEKIESFLKEKKYEELNEYFEKQFPDMKARVLKNTLAAKKLIILDDLDNKITLIKARAKAQGKKDRSEKFIQLQELAYNDKWQDFQKLIQSEK